MTDNNGEERWDATPGELYDLDWRQCNNPACRKWHQMSLEDIGDIDRSIPDPTNPNLVIVPDRDEPGDTCPSCETGKLGQWLPRNAIGKRADGSLILDPDKE